MIPERKMERRIKVAVTGGIGSGKSTVMSIIADEGYRTISLDQVYTEMLDNEKFVEGICSVVDVEPIIIDGKKLLDRRAVSAKVFNDGDVLSKLNEYTHERILAEAFARGGNGLTFYEVPLLFEGGLERRFDRVIVVKRNLKKRIEAVAERDGLTIEEVTGRIKNQFDYEKNDLSLHTIIENDGDISLLRDKVRKVIREIKEQI